MEELCCIYYVQTIWKQKPKVYKETFLDIKRTIFLPAYAFQERTPNCLVFQHEHLVHHVVGLCFPLNMNYGFLNKNIKSSIRLIQNSRFPSKGLYLSFFKKSMWPPPENMLSSVSSLRYHSREPGSIFIIYHPKSLILSCFPQYYETSDF